MSKTHELIRKFVPDVVFVKGKKYPPSYVHDSHMFVTDLNSYQIISKRTFLLAHQQINLKILEALREGQYGLCSDLLLFVCRRMHGETPEILWRVGCELLDFSSDQNVNNCIRFYQYLQNSRFTTLLNTTIAEAIVLEVSVYCQRIGKLQDGYERLEHALTTSRCAKSIIHRCYAGYLAFMIWNGPTQHPLMHYNELDPNLLNHNFFEAKKHFSLALERGKIDYMFVPTLVRIFLAEREFDEALKLIDMFTLKHEPLNLDALKLKLEYLEAVSADNLGCSQSEYLEHQRKTFDFIFDVCPSVDMLEKLFEAFPDIPKVSYLTKFLQYQVPLYKLETLPYHEYLDAIFKVWFKLYAEIFGMPRSNLSDILSPIMFHFYGTVSPILVRSFDGDETVLLHRVMDIYTCQYCIYSLLDQARVWKPFPVFRDFVEVNLVDLEYLKSKEFSATFQDFNLQISNLFGTDEYQMYF